MTDDVFVEATHYTYSYHKTVWYFLVSCVGFASSIFCVVETKPSLVPKKHHDIVLVLPLLASMLDLHLPSLCVGIY